MLELSGRPSFRELNLQFSVLRLISWPELPDLLLDTAPHVTRICALLARRPSVGMLIPVMLDIPQNVAYALLETLYVNGHISPVGAVLAAEHPVGLKTDQEKLPETCAKTVSFLSKVWHRLTEKR